jgi:divalent metal cation (Fe/Co/Zn/Cd) transporter
MHITRDGDRTLNEAHAATEIIERAIHKIIQPADITVHVEPAEAPIRARRESPRKKKT